MTDGHNMAKHPMDKILDGVQWEPLPPWTGARNNGIPFPTHKGHLKIGDDSILCYMLNDGKRIIDTDDFVRFMGLWLSGGVKE